jgi:hypothetical protein
MSKSSSYFFYFFSGHLTLGRIQNATHKNPEKDIQKRGELLACKSRPDNEEILRTPENNRNNTKTSQESSMLLLALSFF